MFLLTGAVALWTSGIVLLVTMVAATIDGSPHVGAEEGERLLADLDFRFMWVELACAAIALSSWFSLKERFGGAYRNRRTILSMLLAMTLCTAVATLVLSPWSDAAPALRADPAARVDYERSRGTFLVLSIATATLGLSVFFVVARHAVRSLNALESSPPR